MTVGTRDKLRGCLLRECCFKLSWSVLFFALLLYSCWPVGLTILWIEVHHWPSPWQSVTSCLCWCQTFCGMSSKQFFWPLWDCFHAVAHRSVYGVVSGLACEVHSLPNVPGATSINAGQVSLDKHFNLLVTIIHLFITQVVSGLENTMSFCRLNSTQVWKYSIECFLLPN